MLTQEFLIRKGKGLIDYGRFRNSEEVRTVVDLASEYLRRRIDDSASVHLLSSVDESTIDALVGLSSVFPEEIRFSGDDFKEKFHAREDIILLMAKVGERNAGFSLSYYFSDHDPLMIYLTNLAVRSEFKGRGIGQSLLLTSFVIAHNLGYKRLTLDCEIQKGLPQYYGGAGLHQISSDGEYARMCKPINEETVREAIEFFQKPKQMFIRV